ncbi:MAG: exosortase/archaeosortase family protein [Patescibacteria group bacterium]|nr:exosortase/archaeosortase family protein [Patescibacteria group bacterium]
MLPPHIRDELKAMQPRPAVLAGWLVVAAAFYMVYASTLANLIHVWWKMPDYGHGFFVPAFSLVLLWARRDMIKPWPEKGSWWGLAFFALFGLFVVASDYFPYASPVRMSIIPFLAGTALIVGGWRGLHWSWPAIVFLIFMVPLPEAASALLRDPLQRIGTKSSVFIIVTLGIPANAQGNVIHLTEGQLGVVEACSGLRMLMLFFAVCIGAAFVLKQPWWEKVVIVLSAVPIAVLANVFRIAVTAVLHDLVSTELADKVFHNGAGMMMMPVAIAMLSAELWLISHLVVEPTGARPIPIGAASGARVVAPATRGSRAPAAAILTGIDIKEPKPRTSREAKQQAAAEDPSGLEDA